MVHSPAEFTVAPSQLVLHRKRQSLVERSKVNLRTPVAVIGMKALDPAVADFLLKFTAREIEPALADVRAKLVRARHPDHHRRGVGHDAKAPFTLAQCFSLALAVRD